MPTDWKDTSYNSIFVVIDRLTKMVYYEPMQITIDAPALGAGYTPLGSLHASPTRETLSSIPDPSSNLKTFRTDLANPFLPNPWGYVHGFSYHNV